MDERSGVCCLVIKPSKKEDIGEYECMAKNRAGEASTYCEVIVDQMSDSDSKMKRNIKAKSERLTERQDPARGMSTDMMESDEEANGSFGFYFLYCFSILYFYVVSLNASELPIAISKREHA